MPWMVTIFGILVIPLGLTHIILVISQPVVVGSWCTMCLMAAAIMLPMIPLEVDEVIAMGQHVGEARRRGDHGGSLWRVFWKGGSAEGAAKDERTPPLATLPEQPGRVLGASFWGLGFPAPLLVSAVLGVWLVFSPTVFDTGQPASVVAHLGGSLAVVVAIISCGEVVRAGRLLNIVLGLGIAIAPWFLSGGTTLFRANALVIGLLLAVLALPRGPVRERYGSWDRFIV